jgi:precorrin-2/cobalt-factor-2 C20-methyltransferase
MLNSVLYCVGCGPGDPELITIKAINLIKNADIIFTPTARENKPSVALSIVGMYIPKEAEVRQLIFPMTKDAAKLKESWEKNAREISEEIRSGKKAVYLTVGDPSLYSTWIYIHKEIQSNYNDIKVEIVPGITSIFSFSAELKTPVGEGEEIIGIIPACYNLDRLKTAAECCDTLVFLKDGRYFNSVIDILMESNFSDDSDVYIAQDVSTKYGSLQKRKLADIARNKNENNDKYFSIMIAKKKK